MKKISEIRIQTAYLFSEKNGEVRKICPSFSGKLNQENLEMIFIPEDTTEDTVLLEVEDIGWLNPFQGDFDYEINSDSILSKVQFSRTDTDKELIQFLDCKIGQRILTKKYGKEGLKDMYFFVEGIIYPATEQNNPPIKERVQFYDIREARFITPEKFEGGYYFENDRIEEAPFKLWPIIKEMANENETV